MIPGEDAAELEALAASYREQFPPESPQNAVLVDALIAADWQLRRLRKIEARLWQRELADANAAADVAEAYSRNKVLDQVQRRIQTTERHFRQTLKQLRQIRKEDEEAQEKEARRKKVQEMIDNARAQARARVRAAAARQVEAEMGSFLSGEEDLGYPPDREDTEPK